MTLTDGTAHNTCPTLYRGHYFPSSLTDPAYVAAHNVNLNSHGSIELWILPDTIQNQTMYSRSTTDNSGPGTEDFLNFQTKNNGGLTMSCLCRNVETLDQEEISASSENDRVVTTSW